jgi:predicted methyltransferase
VARDKYRHPAETLAFFGVKGSQTVLEYEPEGGWYAEILAPLAARGGGLYIAAQPGERFKSILGNKFAANRTVYGIPKIVDWPAGAAVPSSSVDVVLTFRNVHNQFMGEDGGNPAALFAEFFRILKPGGVLGVVDHRMPESGDASREGKSGYLKVSTVKKHAQAAGFVFEASSEVNANPKDTADWPGGVWTLPPTLGQEAKDRDKYLAIGESDRMTLRFRKPKR